MRLKKPICAMSERDSRAMAAGHAGIIRKKKAGKKTASTKTRTKATRKKTTTKNRKRSK